MTEKEMFIENMKKRTKKFAVDVIEFCDTLKTCKASSVITYQLVKSATSTGANYRAASRAKTRGHVPLLIESEYWLEVIKDANLSNEVIELEKLLKETMEIVKITSKAKNSSYSK